MHRRLALFLALLVAAFMGVVPLRECFAADAARVGVFAFGAHAHATDAASHDGDARCDGDHGCHHGAADAPGEPCGPDADCCADAPFHAAASGSVVSADRGLDTASSPLLALRAVFDTVGSPVGGIAGAARPDAPDRAPDPLPSGVRETVLLR